MKKSLLSALAFIILISTLSFKRESPNAKFVGTYVGTTIVHNPNHVEISDDKITDDTITFTDDTVVVEAGSSRTDVKIVSKHNSSGTLFLGKVSHNNIVVPSQTLHKELNSETVLAMGKGSLTDKSLALKINFVTKGVTVSFTGTRLN